MTRPRRPALGAAGHPSQSQPGAVVCGSHILRWIHAPDAIQLQARSTNCGWYALCVPV